MTEDSAKPPTSGFPGNTRPSVEEPTTPTGQNTGTAQEKVAQGGEFLIPAHGARPKDPDHALRVGERGPILLRDHHFREKISRAGTKAMRNKRHPGPRGGGQ